jgi:hypothetical protein
MSLFVEVDSVEKGCPVIINLDSIVEIAPLATGGCALFTTDGAGMNSRSAMRVKNDYTEFKQFVMQTVSAEDIAARFPKKEKEPAPVDDIFKAPAKTKKSLPAATTEYDIPKL